MLLSFNVKSKKKKERERERLIIITTNGLILFGSCSLDLQFFNVQDKNKIRGLRYFFRMFFVFLRIGQIKVSYYIEKSKICKFSPGCSFFDITKVGRAWKMFGKYDAIFTIGSLACKFYRYQSLKLGFFYIYITYILSMLKSFTLYFHLFTFYKRDI